MEASFFAQFKMEASLQNTSFHSPTLKGGGREAEGFGGLLTFKLTSMVGPPFTGGGGKMEAL